MKKFLFWFGIFIIFYHIIVTIIGYKFLGGKYIEQIALSKELIRGFFIIITFLQNKKEHKQYFQIRKYPRTIFLITIIFSIGISLLDHKTITNIIVGLKYDFHFLFVFLTATIIGFFRKNDKKYKKKESRLSGINFLRILQYTIGIIIVLGFLRQAQRLFLPNIMTQLGYGPVGDFNFGVNPPVYYRTGPGGFPRLQGIFSGPNNYGYFLVAFLPLILLRWKPKKLKELKTLNPEKILRFSLIILRLTSILLTISRTAFIGAILAIIFFYKKDIKKLSKKIKILGISIIFFLLILVSIFKRESTQKHINTKINGIISAINHPLGQGLGTAGPAIFHNGIILPENFFIEIMIDIGTLGFLIRILIIFYITLIQKNIYNHYTKDLKNKENEILFIQRNYLNLGRSCLLIMGLFLHVFEDSMVNYLFFVPYGILTGYLSKNIRIQKNINILNIIKTLKK